MAGTKFCVLDFKYGKKEEEDDDDDNNNNNKEKAEVHEGDSDTNCNWCAWNGDWGNWRSEEESRPSILQHC